MAISKKHKKQIKNQYKSAQATGEVQKVKRTWSLKQGDLVKFSKRDSEVMGIVSSDDRGDGWYCVIFPGGKQTYHARHREKIQSAKKLNDLDTKQNK